MGRVRSVVGVGREEGSNDNEVRHSVGILHCALASTSLGLVQNDKSGRRLNLSSQLWNSYPDIDTNLQDQFALRLPVRAAKL
jgi:hypothetical protein